MAGRLQGLDIWFHRNVLHITCMHLPWGFLLDRVICTGRYRSACTAISVWLHYLRWHHTVMSCPRSWDNSSAIFFRFMACDWVSGVVKTTIFPACTKQDAHDRTTIESTAACRNGGILRCQGHALQAFAVRRALCIFGNLINMIRVQLV